MTSQEKSATEIIEEIKKRIISLKKALEAEFVIVAYRTGLPIVSTETVNVLEPEPRLTFNAASFVAKLRVEAELGQRELDEIPRGLIIEGAKTNIVVRGITGDTTLIFRISTKKIWTEIVVERAIKSIKEILAQQE